MSEKKNSGQMKILYMIFSVAVSISLWTYVAYIDNPMLEKPVAVNNVPVELTGEEYLRDYNLMVSDIDVKELTVYFTGRQRDASEISKMNVRAVVDLKDVLKYSSPSGIHSLEFDLIYDTTSSTIAVDSVSRPVVEVTVERVVTETFTIRPVFQGSVAEGYMADTLSLSMDTVDISGTEAAIARISSVTATLENRENLTRSVTDEIAIKLFDDEGQEIDMEEEGLTFANGGGTVFITQTILMKKTVSLVVNVGPSATANDSNISINIEPSTITLAGDPAELDALNTILLGTVDLKSFSLNYENTFPIRLPDVKNLSGATTATVKISVIDSNIDLRRISANNISYRNAADNDEVTVITESLDITLRGDRDSLQEVTAENIRIVADLSGCPKGTTTAPAKVYVDGFDDVEAVGTYNVTVTIS